MVALIPEKIRPYLLIIVGLACLVGAAYQKSDWLHLWLVEGVREKTNATVVDTRRTLGATRNPSGVILTVEYQVAGQSFREQLGINHFRDGINEVPVGRVVPVMYASDDPTRVILAQNIEPGSEIWAMLVLGLAISGLGVAQIFEDPV